jgi:ABC-type phosphate/phosphonate transport system substrate-binding protein
MATTIIMGCTEYSAKVPELWQGFKEYFQSKGLDYDFRTYPTYEDTVLAHVDGETDVSWHSPFSWVEIERLARSQGRVARVIGMRDTDRDNSSYLLVRADSRIKTLDELRGTRMGIGAQFTAETTLIPFEYLQRHGLQPGKDFSARSYVPKGGLNCQIGNAAAGMQALKDGQVDSCWVRDGQYRQLIAQRVLAEGDFALLAETATYDHCNFSIIADRKHPLVDRFVQLLLDMDPVDPQVKQLFKLEGLNRWLPGRDTGYAALHRAAELFGMPPQIETAMKEYQS